MEHILYWLWLTGLFGVRSGELIPLVEYFGSIEELYKQRSYPSLDRYRSVTLEKLNNKGLSWANKIYKSCEQRGIGILTYDSSDFPPDLRNIYTSPTVLYSRGIIPDWERELNIGVVGTRKATDYGVKITTEICGELAKRGVTVVSGFAKGIDSAATNAAILAGAYNIAVFACGVDIKYPKGRESMYEAVIENGLILSEYPPGMPPAKWTFPKRNRIIAGISRGVLVTEAPEISGALITARAALDENRDVFAVPGKIDDTNTKGINNLIKQGAKPVFSADDILCEYEHYLKYLTPAEPKKSEPAEVTKTGTEGEILKLLTVCDMHIDELIRKTNVPMNDFNTAVMMLEITGFVSRRAGNVFHREK